MTLYDLYTLASIPYLYILYFLFILFCLAHIFHRNERFELFDVIFRRKWWIALPVSCVIAGLLLCSNSSLVWMMGGRQDLRLAPNGTYCYYVVASREYTSKEYTLPARIEKTDGNYVITNVYFPNGGYLYFDSPDYTEVEEKNMYGDQDGDGWEIKLNNNQTSHPKVYTNYSVGYVDIIITIAGALVVFISMILYCFRIKIE